MITKTGSDILEKVAISGKELIEAMRLMGEKDMSRRIGKYFGSWRNTHLYNMNGYNTSLRSACDRGLVLLPKAEKEGLRRMTFVKEKPEVPLSKSEGVTGRPWEV